MKSLTKGSHPLDDSIGYRFSEVLVWKRRFWGQYYQFEYELDAFCIRVFKIVYNEATWEEEEVLVHTFDAFTVNEWSKRPDAFKGEDDG